MQVRFFESRAAPSDDQLARSEMGQLTSDSLSARCRDTAVAYEANINPFAAFHRRERQQRLAELNPVDRLVLT